MLKESRRERNDFELGHEVSTQKMRSFQLRKVMGTLINFAFQNFQRAQSSRPKEVQNLFCVGNCTA